MHIFFIQTLFINRSTPFEWGRRNFNCGIISTNVKWLRVLKPAISYCFIAIIILVKRNFDQTTFDCFSHCIVYSCHWYNLFYSSLRFPTVALASVDFIFLIFFNKHSNIKLREKYTNLRVTPFAYRQFVSTEAFV